MKIDPRNYRVEEGEGLDLSKRTRAALDIAKAEYSAKLERHTARLRELQERLYAANSHALLVVFQGMDTAGKDGAISHVMAGVDPQGCEVTSFKQPSTDELQHDFLWRAWKVLPGRGRIGIFNRSYYEEVIVTRVHPELLANQGPVAVERAAGKGFWKDRYRSIVAMEQHLHDSGTEIVKVFLHVSAEEQRLRLLARIDEPEKNWKFQLGDVVERDHWPGYMRAYERCLSATSTARAPWYVVPADDKLTARLIVSQIIIDALDAMDLRYPRLSRARRNELKAIRQKLEGSSSGGATGKG